MQYILPDWFPTKWLTLFTQPWEGDITVVLPSHLWNLGKTMVNPTTVDILAATKSGELAIWEKLSAIETNCTIEATLDACLARLTNKVRERPLTGLTSRIPSWLSMPAVGQQAVASWGNPLDAGASPGGRLWNRSKSSQALLNGSTGHLPSLLQAQQGSAGSSPAAVGPGGAWYFAGGNAALSASTLLASAGVGAAVLKGDAAAAGSAAAAAPAGLYGGVPATVSDAIAAMADGANMGGTHRGYSYTAPALHSAHMQQHGSPAVAAEHAQAAAAAVAAHTGGASTLHGSAAGSSYGSSGSGTGFMVGSPGSSGFMSSSVGSGGGSTAALSVPPTIHEVMPDDRPPRVTSWGSNDIADSVSDFPASCSGGGYGAAGSGSSRAGRAHQAAVAAAAAAAAVAAGSGSGQAVQEAAAVAAQREHEQQHEQPGTPESVETLSSNAAAGGSSSRHSKGSRRHSSASSTCSSGSSGSARLQSEIAGQLDCCDSSVVTDIWSMFMPLATSSLALEVATSEGLDFIAP
jgi:TAG lipase/steryl ester hydrolase/phospholipase A2/LPA acyltransferase